MTKVKKPGKIQPNPQAPPLSVDVKSLVLEWRFLAEQHEKLQERFNQSTKMIELAENTIKEVQLESKVLVGKLEILARIFNGMGVNPNEFEIPAEKPSEEPPKFPSEVPPPVD